MAITLHSDRITWPESSGNDNQYQSAYFFVPGYRTDFPASKWVNFTSSRSIGVNYTNSTDGPIAICITVGQNYATSLYIGDARFINPQSTVNGTYPVHAIIPNGRTYRVGESGSATTLTSWFELRN